MLTCLFRKRRLRRGQPPIISLRLRASPTGLSPRLDAAFQHVSSAYPQPNPGLYLASECTIASWMHLSIGHWSDVAIFFSIATTTFASLRRTAA